MSGKTLIPSQPLTPWRKVKGYKPYSIFLDDKRDLPPNTSPFPWEVCRTVEHLAETIEHNGLPQFIGFDSDLGDQGSIYDAVKWIAMYCEKNQCNFPRWDVHSKTPRGVFLKGQLLGAFPSQHFPDGYL
jgi:hypothetical protein